MDKENLKILRDKLKRGDMKLIAERLNKTTHAVYNTLAGTMTSQPILNAVIEYLEAKNRLEKKKAETIKKCLD